MDKQKHCHECRESETEVKHFGNIPVYLEDPIEYEKWIKEVHQVFIKEIMKRPNLGDDQKWKDNLIAMNLLMGSTKRLLKELYFEATVPSSILDMDRFSRIADDLRSVLMDFLISAIIRRKSFIIATKENNELNEKVKN